MTVEQNYIDDILKLLIEKAKEAKADSQLKSENSSEQDLIFNSGRALAYYEVLSTMIGLAGIFGLSKEIMPTILFDPDKELLSNNQKP
ncbi:hypothetical protein [Leptospira sarikeiensis]|uniref:Uncharacterized protein n=1 Tax=Leptospira sarikeiensis TaxID=2484943 RepID=A0A4R9K9V9_9LEPT|nr:hypothetical protein [Leptospira sarikeiensis]TGL63478.1 hypothetical protein EHQ64_05870 [Leptospira sarikeiensis]